MPVRSIDPKVALIIIDFQEGTRRFTGLAGPAAYANAARLAHMFREHHHPVILVCMAGGVAGRSDVAPMGSNHQFSLGEQAFVPELKEEPSDIRIMKTTWGAFHGTQLAQELAKCGVTQVVLCGTAASLGVEATARQAYERGFNTTVAIDAITDFNLEAMKNSVERIFPLLGETGTVSEISAVIQQQEAANPSAG
jgi:nicotinamidase-related amidase